MLRSSVPRIGSIGFGQDQKNCRTEQPFFWGGEVSRQTGEPEEPHSSTLWNFHCRMGGARVPRKSKKDLFLFTLVQHLGGRSFCGKRLRVSLCSQVLLRQEIGHFVVSPITVKFSSAGAYTLPNTNQGKLKTKQFSIVHTFAVGHFPTCFLCSIFHLCFEMCLPGVCLARRVPMYVYSPIFLFLFLSFTFGVYADLL